MPTGSFIWGSFEAPSKLKLVIVYIVCADTAAASAGLPPWLVKTLGGWSSDCCERYIQCSQSILSGVA